MFLINIDMLSDSELRYIAQQEDLEEWASLSREELIESLEELYDEPSDDATDIQNNHKFVKTLTGVDSANSLNLPGVSGIPESYNETSIHAILIDCNWVHVFWNISSKVRDELAEEGKALLLRCLTCGKKEQQSFDIDISAEDDNWNIELPKKGETYKVRLISRKGDSEETICESSNFRVESSYYMEHPEDLRDPDTFRIVFGPVVSKFGNLINNRQIRELYQKVQEAGR